jgi:CRISPR/Cas system-associated exonuclease Cas4 (RecB family)
VHSALEWFHGEKIIGKTPPALEVMNIFRADFDSEMERPVRWKDTDDPGELAERGAELVGMYVEHFKDVDVHAAEMPFQVPLVDHETGEVFPWRLRGYFDLILAGDQLVEMKTAARRLAPNDLLRRVQLSAYAYAYRERFGRDPILLVTTLLKTKKPALEIITTNRTYRDDAFFAHLADQVARGIIAEAFPPNPGWMCEGCEYQDHCGAWRGTRTSQQHLPIITEPDTDRELAIADQ